MNGVSVVLLLYPIAAHATRSVFAGGVNDAVEMVADVFALVVAGLGDDASIAIAITAQR